jgi:hypothetical protein
MGGIYNSTAERHSKINTEEKLTTKQKIAKEHAPPQVIQCLESIQLTSPAREHPKGNIYYFSLL